MKQIYKNIIKIYENFLNYQNKKRKKIPKLKERDKVYLLIKKIQNREKIKNLTMLKLDYFLLKLRKELLATKSSYSKMPNYNLYSICCY